MAGSHATATPILLIIEDSNEQRELLQDFLEEALTCRVVSAADGTHGLALAQETTPDLVLLDLNLPPNGGLEVLNRMRKDPHLSEVPVIVLSGSRRPTDMVAVRQAGCFSFIEKPYNLTDIEEAVLAALGRG